MPSERELSIDSPHDEDYITDVTVLRNMLALEQDKLRHLKNIDLVHAKKLKEEAEHQAIGVAHCR